MLLLYNMGNCWAYMNSFPPFRRVVRCPHCKKLEWRGNVAVERIQVSGCMKCRLDLYRELRKDKLTIHYKCTKKFNNFKTTGRYEL